MLSRQIENLLLEDAIDDNLAHLIDSNISLDLEVDKDEKY